VRAALGSISELKRIGRIVSETLQPCTTRLLRPAPGICHRDTDFCIVSLVKTTLDIDDRLLEPVESHFLWRPQLRDPADEMVLEAAVNGGATAIVTFNARDFGASAAGFGLALLTPSSALRRIRS